MTPCKPCRPCYVEGPFYQTCPGLPSSPLYTVVLSSHICLFFVVYAHIFAPATFIRKFIIFGPFFTFCSTMMVRSMVVTKMQAQRVLTNLDVDPRPCGYLSPLFWIDPSIHRRFFSYHRRDFSMVRTLVIFGVKRMVWDGLA